MRTTGRERFLTALRDHTAKHIDSRALQVVIGVVTGIGSDPSGFTVEVPEHGFTLDSDNLLVTQPVAQYDQDYGIVAGDSMVVACTAGGDWIAIGVMTDAEATSRGDGGSLLSGTGAPAGGTGMNGDYYVDAASHTLYGPKAAGSWPSGVPLVGPTGPTGPTGPAGPAWPLVSTLPSSPNNGDIVYYQNTVMATRGVVWAFRYNSSSTSPYKWEFVGGGPLLSFVYPDGSPSTKPTVTGWTDSVSPSITVPLNGEYITDAEVYVGSSGSGLSTILMGVMRSTIDTGGPPVYNGAGSVPLGSAFSIRSRCFWTAIDLGITLGAGGVMTQMQYNFPYVATSWSFKGISLLPVRVSP